MTEHEHNDECVHCQGHSMEEVVASYGEMIREHGWAACAVVSETEPAWIYTLGLQGTYGHPELVIYGLGPRLAHDLLRCTIEKIQRGEKIEPGTLVDEVMADPYKMAAVKVDEPLDPRYPLNMATWFTDDADIEAIQLVWPDAAGRYPWDESGQPEQAVFGTF